ncbi:hypothetical protein EV126DRAFT_384100 [Verticillium dahliae]|nr:hypothetical protein EV126DRAFT_384100 [Verticillium dahliae]
MSPQYRQPSVEACPETANLSSQEQPDHILNQSAGVIEHPPSSASTGDTQAQDPVAELQTSNATLMAQAPRRRSRTAPVCRTASVPAAGVPASSRVRSPDHSLSSSMSASNKPSQDAKLHAPAPRPPSPSTSTLTASTAKTSGSGSSSGSASTVTQIPASNRRNSDRDRDTYKQKIRPRDKQTSHSPEIHQRPDVMSFLQPGSPPGTRQPVQRTRGDMSSWQLADLPSRTSPTRSTTSSGAPSIHSDVFSEPGRGHETDGTLSSPDRSVNEDWSKPMMLPAGGTSTASSYHQRHQHPSMWDAGPMMPPAHSNQVHDGPPNGMQSQPQYLPSSFDFMQHGRPEHMPMSGYELLATNLSSNSMGGPVIKPMYRRFEFLNHRLLLHLQDELAELEEQLRHLDAADTQSRQYHQGVLPASRRQESTSSKDLHWWKTDLLGKIGFKLELYNKTLVSFKESQNLSAPAPADIDRYRDYLNNRQPVVEPEARFLDPEDDLVSLARPHSTYQAPEFSSDDLQTPMPRTMVFPPTPNSPLSDLGSYRSTKVAYAHDGSHRTPASSMPQILIAISAAFLLPILCFIVIPGYIGRMAVVMIVAGGLLAALLQAGVLRMGANGLVGLGGTQDCILCIGVYGAVMAVVAGVL